jgi:hypothetical protein
MKLIPPAVRKQIIDAVALELSRIEFLKEVIMAQNTQIRDLSHQLALTERQLADALDAKGER